MDAMEWFGLGYGVLCLAGLALAVRFAGGGCDCDPPGTCTFCREDER